jgi:hypothetical protein
MRAIVAGSIAIVLAAAAVTVVPAQTKPESLSGVQRLEGDWVRIDPDGSGDFGGLTSKFTPASLTPQGSTLAEAMRRIANAARGPAYSEDKAHATGQAYVVVSRPCGTDLPSGGGLALNPDSSGMHFVVGKDEIIFAPERSGIRHIYMDGRQHPALTRWTPTGGGHSVGHVENGELIVDTMGITQGVVTAGGARTPETHLIERFVLSPDGDRLAINYRWEDPKIYQKPHEYHYEFERLPAGSYAFEKWCDASDPAEQYSVVPPAQQ